MVAVLRWFRFGKKQPDAPLTGASPRPRLKSYSAQSGYVYQYVFCGQRPSQGHRKPGIEYAFDVCYDRKTNHRVWVLVSNDALEPWVRDNGRQPTNSERYGVAKIALRNAFDERSPMSIEDPIAPDPDEIRAILDELGV